MTLICYLIDTLIKNTPCCLQFGQQYCSFCLDNAMKYHLLVCFFTFFVRGYPKLSNWLIWLVAWCAISVKPVGEHPESMEPVTVSANYN